MSRGIKLFGSETWRETRSFAHATTRRLIARETSRRTAQGTLKLIATETSTAQGTSPITAEATRGLTTTSAVKRSAAKNMRYSAITTGNGTIVVGGETTMIGSSL